jgi:hypothetical protein
MIVGMLLAISTYHFIFGQFIKLSDPITRVEVVAARKVLETKTTTLPKTPSDSVKAVVSEVHYEDGAVFKETKTDTLFTNAARQVATKTVVAYTNRKLGTSAYIEAVCWVFVLILYVTMVYGPIAAFLVEMFPTKIRYTSMSLPYHIGNGVFGGLCPFIATLLTTIHVNDKLYGLWYPILVGGVCIIIGAVYVRNRKDPEVND